MKNHKDSSSKIELEELRKLFECIDKDTDAFDEHIKAAMPRY